MSDTDFLIANSAAVQPDIRSYESVGNQGFGRSRFIKPKRFLQYFAAFSATLSALSAGVVLGWTSPIEDGDIVFNNVTITSNSTEMGWIGSIVNIGAFFACIPTGFFCDMIGRKSTLLLITLPYSIGWIIVFIAKNVYVLYLGRFILGIATGATCVAAPLYTSEIAQKEIRGALGIYFQLMVVLGVLYSYTLGALMTFQNFTFTCILLPFVFAGIYIFQPDTPLYYLKKGLFDEAKTALVYLRGIKYNHDDELLETERIIRETQDSAGFFRALRRRCSKKAILISLTLMLFQQLSGINAIVFYTSSIFKDSGVTIDPKHATIIIGVTQVISTFTSSLIVDKIGRRILLSISAALISISIILLGVFFYLKTENIVPEETLKSLSFLPIVFLIIYVVAFSIGFGPIPWMISGEIFAAEIKSVASSLAATFNWFLAFLITKYYFTVETAIGEDYTFFAFGICMLFVHPFIYYVVPETKGKSLATIQSELDH